MLDLSTLQKSSKSPGWAHFWVSGPAIAVLETGVQWIFVDFPRHKPALLRFPFSHCSHMSKNTTQTTLLALTSIEVNCGCLPAFPLYFLWHSITQHIWSEQSPSLRAGPYEPLPVYDYRCVLDTISQKQSSTSASHFQSSPWALQRVVVQMSCWGLRTAQLCIL